MGASSKQASHLSRGFCLLLLGLRLRLSRLPWSLLCSLLCSLLGFLLLAEAGIALDSQTANTSKVKKGEAKSGEIKKEKGLSANTLPPSVTAQPNSLKLMPETPKLDQELSRRHSQSLPAVTKLRAGVTFTDAEMELLEKKIPTANMWFRIPNSLAGRWSYYQGETTSFFDLKSGSRQFRQGVVPSSVILDWGYQRDEHGDIWQFDDSPNTVSTRNGENVTIYTRKSLEPLEQTDDRLVCRSHFVYSTVDLSDNKIVKTFQSENIVNYECKGDDLVRTTSSKIFDEDGCAIAVTTAYSRARKIYPFVPVNKKGELNLRRQFRQFLIDSGLKELVPLRGPDQETDIW